jgi:hypothetical protein
VRYKLLPGHLDDGRYRVKVRGRDEIIHFEPEEVTRRAVGLHYRPPGARYAVTRYESAVALLQMYPHAIKAIFDLTDDGYEHVCEKARAMKEIWG